MDDAQRLAELLHAAEVAVVAVAVDADGDVEVDLVVGVVGLALAHVPGHAGAAQHDAREGVVEGVGGGDDADALRAALPDAVVGQELFGFVDAVAELRRPLVDVVEKAEREVLRDAAGSDVGGVQAGAGDAFVEFLGGRVSVMGWLGWGVGGGGCTISFSRSSKPHRKGVRAPTSMACEQMDMRWFKTRVISANRVLIHFALAGTSIFSNFSVANEKHCSFVIMDT